MEFNNNKGEEKFPFSVKFVEEPLNSQLLEHFHGEKTGFVQAGDEKWFFPSKFLNCAQNFYNFQARPDDVWICTYPRSGTTWTQEMLWLICNDLDFETAGKEKLTKRFPFFEFHIYMHDEMKEQFLAEATCPEHREIIEAASKPAYDYLNSLTGQRFIKTHFPISLLPPSIFHVQAKVIYVARNPSDVVVSYYHLNKLYRTQGYVGDFETFYNYFEKDLTPWSPYWSHLREGWQARSLPNVLFMFYEDMNKDLPATIRKVGAFLGKPDLSDEQVATLVDHLSIRNFKNNTSVNGEELKAAGILNSKAQDFIRKGQVNGSGSELTDEIKERIRVWSERHLAKTDMRFPEV
ncbi:hypothetical protein quinque_013000 [Culex quinquefasciatus]|uniref:sulfotransferase 1E1 n=1 Tax=Culex quinquefasciatus TaxID=7176 RepID=UPI0018E2D710|nr:sulfotransferase 1E1 [Culex quinquefasciatus]XP_038105412.1 sulfotransferase 1E1 [Culex quinquefasciatus]